MNSYQQQFYRTIFILVWSFTISSFLFAEGTNLSIPLVFRENAGQWDSDILFKGNSSSGSVFFTKNSLVVAHTKKNKSIIPERDDELEHLYWRINFEGASDKTVVRPLAQAASYTNYLTGTSEKHRSNVPDYNELMYESIYEGIDLHYYTQKSELKYDFILSPEANIADICMSLDGIKNIKLNKNGSLEITHKWGTIKEEKPYSYQEINGEKIEVDIRYELKSKKSFGYKVYGKYDPTKKIVIDPVMLIWATYIGGSNTSISGYQYDIVTDDAGNTYGTGYYPGAFPVVSGSYDQTFNGGYGDVFVYKMDPEGKSLIYATYVGGSDDDRGMAIDVNETGEVYVTGYSFSPVNSFPNTATLGATLGSSNVFVFKLNSSGSTLIYSTLIGANDQERGLDIKVFDGKALIVGETKSFNFPMGNIFYNNIYNGGSYDGFVLKLNIDGNAIDFSSFIGGSSEDRVKGIAFGEMANFFITGYTRSSNFPVSPSALDNSHNGGSDVFVMKFGINDISLKYSTFIGSIYDEEGLAIDVSKNDEAYVTGYTFSNTFPITTSDSYNGLKEIFVTKLSQNGDAIIYSRFIGGLYNEEATDIVVDDIGRCIIAGQTESSTFPIIGFDQEFPIAPRNLESNVFVTLFSPDGTQIRRSVLIGGSYDDYNKPSLGLTSRKRICNISVGFTSHSPDIPTTNNVYQQTKLNGGELTDQLVLYRMYFGPDSLQPFLPIDPYVCLGDIVELNFAPCSGDELDYGCNQRWIDDGVTSYDNPLYIEVTHHGQSFMNIRENGCERKMFSERFSLPMPPDISNVEGKSTLCDDQASAFSLELPQNPGTVFLMWYYSRTFYPLDSSAIGTPYAEFINGYQVLWPNGSNVFSSSGDYWVKATNRCGEIDSALIRITEASSPTISLGPDRSLCFPSSVILNASNVADSIPTSYQWTPSGSTPSITINQPGNYCVTKTNECGSTNDCVMIDPIYTPNVDLGNDTSLCNGNPIILNAGNAGSIYLWSPGGQTTQTITVTNPGVYAVTVTNSCGTDSDQITVGLVDTPPNVNLGTDLLLCNLSDFPYSLNAGNLGSNYYWSTGATGQNISVTEGGQYHVLVTNGCGIDEDTINITAPPQLGLNLGNDTILCGPSALLLDAGNEGAIYLWSPGGQTSQTRTVTSSGNYSVTVSNVCGSASDDIDITIQLGLPIVNLGPDRYICSGSPTLLDVGTAIGQTYLWSTGATTSSITVSSVGIYWVEVTNSCGTTRDEIILSDLLTSFSLGPDRYVCAPSTVSLNAAGAGTSYLWSTGSSASSITANATGIYWVDITASCGVIRDSVFVSIVSNPPVVNLGPDQTICTAFSLVLNASNPGSYYSWSLGGQTTSSITVNTGGQYSVSVTNGCGAARDTVVIISQPLSPLGPDIMACTGTTVTLDAGNIGSTYLWSPGGQTTRTISVNSSGTYGVSITNVCGNITDNVVVTFVNDLPSVNLGPDLRACAPANFILDAGTSGTSYMWSTGASTQTIAVSNSGTYHVTVSGTVCGTASDTVLVTVDIATPTVSLGSDQTLCYPFTSLLDAGSGASSYSWNTGETTPTKLVSAAGNYSVTVSNSCGDAFDDITIVGVSPPSIALRDTGGCINPIVLFAGNPGVTYLWTPFGQTTSSITVSSSGNYGLFLSNVCGIVSATADVIINLSIPTLSLGADTNLCSPSGLLLNAGIHPGGSYLWSPGGETTQTNTVTQHGMYSVTVTNYCGPASDNITVAANPVSVNALYDDTICYNASVQLFTDSLPSYTYNWTPENLLNNPHIPSPIASPIETTTFWVTVSDNVCYNTDSVTIFVDQPIKPRISIFPPRGEGLVPLEISFSDRDSSGTSYFWDFGDGSTSTLISPKHTFNSENYFDVIVTAITELGCSVRDTVTIKAFTLFIPNLITPNGDGQNDTWKLTVLHDKLEVEIYNRWGDRVYKNSNYTDQWDGKDLSDGVYYFIVKDGIFGKTYTGWVQIIR